MKTKTLLLTIVISIITLNLFAQIPTDGLVGYWPFNGNANDASGNGNNGTVEGATLTSDRFGNANSAYSFDGDDDYITRDISLPTSDITFSFWFNANEVKASNQKVFYTLHQFNMGIDILSDGYLQLYWSEPGKNINSSQSITIGLWYHIVIVKDNASNFNFVINNVSQGTEISTTGPTWSSYRLGYDGLGSYYYNGKIDDLRIYNRALDTTEINELYNEGLCFETIAVTDTLIINVNITGFNPVTYQNTFKIYPNPASDHITIDNGDYNSMAGYQIKIVNSLSQEIFQSAVDQQQFYLDLSSWTGNGIYFVHIIDNLGNTIEVKKIILQ